MPLLKPCLDCGELTDATRCEEHRPKRVYEPKTQSRAERGYDWTWQKLSKRARELSPFCEDCGTTEDLTVDHSEEAWRRRLSGKAIRLEDVAVVCRSCNARRGRARPE